MNYEQRYVMNNSKLAEWLKAQGCYLCEWKRSESSNLSLTAKQ